MKKLNFSVDINAPGEKVWDTLWGNDTYGQWTSAFGSEGSTAVTDWQEGSKVLFLGAGGKEGMYSVIDKKQPNTYIAFKHLGVVKEGKEQPQDEETKKWSGAMETYTLKENNGATSLLVTLDATDDFADFFNDTFPKALQKVKDIAESATSA